MLSFSTLMLLLVAAAIGGFDETVAFNLAGAPPSRTHNAHRVSLMSAHVDINHAVAADELQPVPLVGRRSFASHTIGAVASAFLASTGTAGADEPANLYYKSKADEEDPLAVFGKSLQSGAGVDSGAATDSSKERSGAAPLSFGDIELPSSAEAPSAEGGGDLNRALKEKKDSQKRQIDPRTHG